jgi:prolyl 4-hydroxylase
MIVPWNKKIRIDLIHICIIAILLVIIISGIISLFRWYHYTTTTSGETVNKNRGFCEMSDAYDLPQEYPNFITHEEGQYILEKASPLFSESTIVSGTDESIRKSQTAWLRKTDPIVAGIMQRLCTITNLPFANVEDMQVVKYEINGYYNEHHDSCCDSHPNCIDFEKRGGQRIITLIIYLSDDFEGGYTRFPNLNKEYKPKKWDGLLFYPLQRDGEHGKKKAHPLALHAGTPVTKGQKYIANIWIREGVFV